MINNIQSKYYKIKFIYFTYLANVLRPIVSSVETIGLKTLTNKINEAVILYTPVGFFNPFRRYYYVINNFYI